MTHPLTNTGIYRKAALLTQERYFSKPENMDLDPYDTVWHIAYDALYELDCEPMIMNKLATSITAYVMGLLEGETDE